MINKRRITSLLLIWVEMEANQLDILLSNLQMKNRFSSTEKPRSKRRKRRRKHPNT
jgi:hypothetical protein